jgi:hypothetical protein
MIQDACRLSSRVCLCCCQACRACHRHCRSCCCAVSSPCCPFCAFTSYQTPAFCILLLSYNGISPRRTPHADALCRLNDDDDDPLARPPLPCAFVAVSCHHELILWPSQVGRCACPRASHGTQWHRLTPLQAPVSPATPVAKKDPNAPEPTPLEKLLATAGPLRSDGSDKFFGFENVSAPVGQPWRDDAC